MALRRLSSWLTPGALALGLLTATAATAAAQQGSIAGRVTESATGAPVADARVIVVGTSLFATTNAEGRYTIRGVPTGAATVRVLRVGFSEQTRPVAVTAGQTATLDVTLREVAVRLQQVVTTATGETPRVEFGNAVSQIQAPDVVARQPIANMGDLLTTRAPGVLVLPNNMTGTGARVRIRGTHSLSLSNNPIYIIDGVRMTSTASASSISVGGSQPSRVNDINPEEIESIEIVKGPSAATLYGTDATNGVIVITTKKGRAGAPRWTTYAEGGLIQQRNDFPTAYAGWGRTTTNATTTTCFLSRQVSGACTLDSISSYNLFKDPEVSPFGNGYRQQYGAQLSGGTEAVRYFTSGEWESEHGPMRMPAASRRALLAQNYPARSEWIRPNKLDKGSFRVNINASPLSTLDLGLNTNFIRLNQRLPQSDNNTFGVFSSAYGGPGYKYQTSAGDTTPGGLPRSGYRLLTPAEIFRATTRHDVNRFIGSANANWRPTSWLANRANVGVDYSGQTDENLCRFAECPGNATRILGFASDNRVSYYNYTVDLGSTATFQPKEWLNSRTTLGLQYVNSRIEQNFAEGEELPPGAVTPSSAVTPDASTADAISKTLGVFIEEQVGIRQRLFLTGAIRSDQNSAFGTNFQQVYYPKASISWIVSDERFFPRPTWLDQLRLRSSYGASGVQPNQNDALPFFSTTQTNVDRADRSGLVSGSLGNANLRPERATEFEGGFEARLFDSRLSLDLTYYSTLTKDALISRVIAPSSGAPGTSQRQNIGSVKNAGIEALITAQPVRGDRFSWDVTLSGSHNSNKLVSLGDVPPQIGTVVRQVPGYPLNGWWDRTYTFRDANSDGVITASELTVSEDFHFLGYSTPRTEAVLSNGFDLFDRSLRIAALIDYKGGYKIENVTEEFRCQLRNNCRALYDRSVPLEDQARVAALRDLSPSVFSGFIEDGSFVRFRELSVSYTPAERYAARFFRARSATLALSVRNVGFLMKRYSGVDPEMNYGQSEIQNEFQTSPTPTYFTVRLNVGF